MDPPVGPGIQESAIKLVFLGKSLLVQTVFSEPSALKGHIHLQQLKFPRTKW
jgi:hypothetical protein